MCGLPRRPGVPHGPVPLDHLVTGPLVPQHRVANFFGNDRCVGGTMSATVISASPEVVPARMFST